MLSSPDRRSVVAAGISLVAGGACRPSERREAPHAMHPSEPVRMPVLFLGHGSPMNAIEDNPWSRAFRALGATLPLPRAILCVSAHWWVRGSFVTAEDRPRTIHDFGGFPEALFAVEYPAPGSAELARRVRALAGDARVLASHEWGLDHGTWSVLVHLFPGADVPTVQLSLDRSLEPAEHLRLASALAPLREEGVLVIGSGNLVHNLRDAFARMQDGDASVPDWAARFDADVARACAQRDGDFLARALASPDGRQAHPTPEHYLPLLYALGAAGEGPTRFPIEGFDHSLSMRAVHFG